MRFLPGILTRNWTLKLVAFVLAVLLWTLVRVEVPDRQAISGVPVDVRVTDQAWLLAGDTEPAQIQVGFVGPTRGLLRLVADPPVVVLTVDSVNGGDSLLTIGRDDVRFPADAGLTVESIEPASVRVSFERMMSRFFPFQVSTIGTLPSSLALTSLPMAAPTSGNVRGSASAVSELQRIPLEPVDLSLLTATGRVGTTVSEEAMAGFTVTPDQVEVIIRLEPAVDRTFDNVPVVVEGEAGMTTSPDFVGVTIHGAGSVVESINPFDLRVLVRDPPLPLADTGVVLPVVIQGVPPLVQATATSGTVRVQRAVPAGVGS